MKIINSNLKKGEVKLKVENLDDLWYLSHIIDEGDIISGKTLRKIKIAKENERASNVIKKPIFMKLKVEKTEFSENSDMLRALGTVTEGSDDISKGSYHTFHLEENTIFSLSKKKWLKFQLDKLDEASKQKTTKVLICVFDREEADFAVLKKYGFELLSSLKGDVQKKADETKKPTDFYSTIIKAIEAYDKKYDYENIILASPAFFKEDLMKKLSNDVLKKKIVLATCNSTGNNGISEVLKRPEVKEVLKKERISSELKVIEHLLQEISKNNLAAYGFKETQAASDAGAINELIVSDSLITKLRQQGKYSKLDSIMKAVDTSKGKIHIISSDHDGGKKLEGLGGIAAILRYKLNY